MEFLNGSRRREEAEHCAQKESPAPYLDGYPRQTVGGLGFGCSGNVGQKLAVFEPTHGSTPKYAGQFKVNPIATILAAKMMLDWLGETGKGRALGSAVAAVIQGGNVRTYDLGGQDSTLDMTKAIAAKLCSMKGCQLERTRASDFRGQFGRAMTARVAHCEC